MTRGKARKPTVPASETIANTALRFAIERPLDAMYNNELSSTQCEKCLQILYTILAESPSYKSRTAAAPAKIIEIMLNELTLAAPLYGAGPEG